MTRQRLSGILLHPTSLPGPHGSGDLGASAYHFVDWLVAGRQSLWQILPLGGIGPGNSPYMSPSAFAGNELLIDLERLAKQGWLEASDLVPDADFAEERVDYARVHGYRFERLRRAARRFFAAAEAEAKKRFETFCIDAADWLDDYALFMALDARFGGEGAVWQDWPVPLARREAPALREAAATFAEECAFWKFCQWCFDTQWSALKAHANARGIEVIGDVPIFVAAHSADVWAHQALFDLDAQGRPRVVAGVPPDYFSATGQHWGNPLYRWPAHAAENYAWWIARLNTTLKRCDIVRIDHFRGFESYWEIPASEKTAVNGRWKKGPGVDFFSAFSRSQGEHAQPLSRRIIAEDLGVITAEVIALREAEGLPGMRILQFAFDGHADNLYLPHNFEHASVVYTGTHDNDTTCGWWAALAEHERNDVRRYLAISGQEIHWDFIRVAESTIAETCIVPMQDVLGLDSAHRMNQPNQASGSWEWRLSWRRVAPWHAERLAEFARLYGRLRAPRKHAPQTNEGR